MILPQVAGHFPFLLFKLHDLQLEVLADIAEVLDGDLQLFDLHLKVRDLLLGIVDFGCLAFEFLLELLPLLLDALDFLCFEAVLQLIHFRAPFCLLLVELLDLTLNVLQLLREVPFVDAEGHIHEFVFYLVHSVLLPFQLFLLVPELIHCLLIILIFLPLGIELPPFFLNPALNLLKLGELRKDQVTEVHVPSR